MRIRVLMGMAFAVIAAASAKAQAPTTPNAAPRISTMPPRAVGMTGTKITGTMQCGKATRTAMEVADEPGHALASGKTACTWPKPMTLEGTTTKEGASTFLSDVRGDLSMDHGYQVGTMANGDKYFVRFDGRSDSAKGAVVSQTGRWGFTGGTGKLKGLQGRGSYKSTGNPDGSTTVEIEGDYRIAPPAPNAATTPGANPAPR